MYFWSGSSTSAPPPLPGTGLVTLPSQRGAKKPAPTASNARNMANDARTNRQCWAIVHVAARQLSQRSVASRSAQTIRDRSFSADPSRTLAGQSIRVASDLSVFGAFEPAHNPFYRSRGVPAITLEITRRFRSEQRTVLWSREVDEACFDKSGPNSVVTAELLTNLLLTATRWVLRRSTARRIVGLMTRYATRTYLGLLAYSIVIARYLHA